ncbi:MAG: hypothetical protein HZA36_03220, partial [Parcubacteria group bacterium]|nr:hypothetical protein [Parcubacteria group bacterium]
IERFLSHWYILAFYAYWGRIARFVVFLDRYFAFKVTLLNLFHPLYQDYSPMGYILGIFFRLIRLLCGGVVYSIILIIVFVFYLVWVSIPPILIIRAL